jgi:AraC family transcriptional regulator of adaptative response/methylated-DNA-[protein]-cysteine methyltransferase
MIAKFAGISPRRLLMEKKINVFKKEIHNGEGITSSQYAAGYGSSSRLYEKAGSHLGMTPGKYKKGGVGERIFYSLVDTPIGRMLMAATDRGVCSIRFGENDADLISELRLEFPNAEIRQHTSELRPWIEQLDQYFLGTTQLLDIPLELHATTFQLLVWQELRKIPYGETKSYSQLAQAVGKPAAARAVASACAANPVAVINPCHRVIHNDGTISGYRWGLDRKRRLLELEQKRPKG